jgi:glycosyltransferase involved in cell wall biosynthesis
MGEHIVGMMWNKNEGDILAYTIADAVGKVDTLVIADDGSTDNSWDIINAAKGWFDNIEHIQQNPDKADQGQRQQLLTLIQQRYRPEDTWVQIIESDIMILDTDIRKAVKERSDDVMLTWQLLNASPGPEQSWDDLDAYPHWNRPIQEVMTHAHKLELMPYTFRPFSTLRYESAAWRPWPQGFSRVPKSPKRVNDYTPLLAHYGYRGPTHFYKKYKSCGTRHPRYADWDITSLEAVKRTVYLFNGTWQQHAFPMSRYGWMNRKGREKREWTEENGWGPRLQKKA